MFVLFYAGLGALSYHSDATDPITSKQLARQKQAEIDYMRQPFQPEASNSQPASAPALVAVDPQIAKGSAIFAAQPCCEFHGDRGQGTEMAPPLIGVGEKYSSDHLAFLLHHRTQGMIAGGMPSVDFDPADTNALVAYLRSLK